MLRQLARLVPRSLRSRFFGAIKKAAPHQFLPDHADLTFSQGGEDRVLTFLFESLQIPKPRYLDVGTCHPCAMNNTYLFYLQGSTGVCVEPNPDLVPLIREKRPKDVVLNVGVSPDGAGECRYFMFVEPTLNTFDQVEAAARTRSGKYPIIRELSVPVVSLCSIIVDYFKDGLDLLSLDAEGLDFALLRSLDYRTTRPLAICVETVGYSETPSKPKSPEITSLLTGQGYAVFADTFVNTIYIDITRTGSFAL